MSGRREDEVEMHASAAHLRASQRVARVGSWELDLVVHEVDANPLRWSDECYRVFGFEPGVDDASNEIFWRRVHPDDRPLIQAAVAQALATGGVYELEHRIILDDGRERLIHERAELVRDADGTPRRFIGTAQDVTERRQDELRIRAIIEHTPVMMNAFDDAGVCVSWNAECERVTGYTAAEIVGNPGAFELLYPDPDYRQRMLAELAHRGDYRNWAWTLRCKDGTDRTIEWSNVSRTVPLPGWSTWGVGTDVTARIQLEERLRQAQKMEAVGQLAGGVAHDFNNLLTVIQSCCHELLTLLPAADDPLRELVEPIQEAGDRAALLTRQLLLFSRNAPVRPQPLDLDDVLGRTERLMRRLLGEDVKIVIERGPGVRLIKADPGQLEQVIMNLCINARDAMPAGGTLTLETGNAHLSATELLHRPDRVPGEYVWLAITDTGSGITAEVKAHLFEPFFTTKGPGKGTGLGLATVYGIVEASGGFIAVDSTVGVGSRFTVYLPARKDGAATQEVMRSAGIPILTGHETVLVVEDEDAVRRVATTALQVLGYQVLEASGGEQALRLADGHRGPIDLLVTDVVMPEMSGRQLSELLVGLRPELKVLFVSGHSDDAVIRHGVDEFLQKPYTPPVLARRVRDVLGRRRPVP